MGTLSEQEKKLLINCRKPIGHLGNEILDKMNIEHNSLSDWGFKHINIPSNSKILDIGCGGGANISKMLNYDTSKIYGIDYSEASVKKSTELNQAAIDSGKCEILIGSVSNLPFEDNFFDVVTCFETVYFWPDFINDCKEVNRVMKNNATLLICNEMMPSKKNNRQQEIVKLLDMNIYSENEIKKNLKLAGFSKIKTFTKTLPQEKSKNRNHWLLVLANK